MDRYCSYCSSKIFESDRTCSQCGAPTMNYIVGLDKFVKTDRVQNESKRNRNYNIKGLESFFPYSDIRVISRGDSGVFSINARDIFCILKQGRGDSVTREIRRNFQGQTSIVPELTSFSENDVSSLFSSLILGSVSNDNVGLRVSGFSSSEFVRLSQTVSAWNGGAKTVVIGTHKSLANILPNDKNYRYNLDTENRIEYYGNFYQTDLISLPPAVNYGNPFSVELKDDRVWMVSPTEGKLLKIVFEDETLENVGIGLGISSTFATMVM